MFKVLWDGSSKKDLTKINEDITFQLIEKIYNNKFKIFKE